jgi:hypothetical protein
MARFVLALLFVTAAFTMLPHAAADQPLVYPETGMTYVGAFRVPKGNHGGRGYAQFDYGPYALAYNPAKNSLFMSGHPYANLVAEISIPAIKNSQVMANLNVASMLQGFADITEGRATQICDSADQTRFDCANNNPGNLLVTADGTTLIGTWRGYYDAGFQRRSVFTHSTTLAASSFNGFYAPTPPGNRTNRPAAGWLLAIPSEWESRLGGNLASGACCYGITSSAGFGPNLYAFSRGALVGATRPDGANTVAASRLMEFADAGDFGRCTNGTGAYDPSACTTTYNGTTFVLASPTPRAVGWISGTRTIVFAGFQGLGVPCYDPGCIDRCNQTQGSHAYPYTWQMWFFDANDLAAVRQGTKAANAVRPYALWADLPSPQPAALPYPAGTPTSFRGSIPFNQGCVPGSGFGPMAGAFDYVHNRLFVAQPNAEETSGSKYPVVHVWQFAATPRPQPAARERHPNL